MAKELMFAFLSPVVCMSGLRAAVEAEDFQPTTAVKPGIYMGGPMGLGLKFTDTAELLPEAVQAMCHNRSTW